MAGFGGTAPKSNEARALDSVNSQKHSFVNRDFTKNMAWLNNSVDIHTVFLKKLQSGVESANENFIEQIQGFAADLLLLFAGLEPTGVNIGDLKYIFQGLGAMFGINPGTPFPLNLFEAAGHFFGNFIAPLEQFTDLIFDAIFAWAEDLGFSPDFLEAVGILKDSIENLADSFGGFFNRLVGLLDIFGIFSGAGGGIGSGIGGLVNDILDFFSDIVMPSLKPIINAISQWTVPFVNALSGTINTLSRLINGIPIGHVTNKKVNLLGEGGFPTALSMETGDTWVWDGTVGRTTLGAARVNANSVARELESIDIPVTEDQQVDLSVWLRWSGLVYTGTAPVQLRLNRYMAGTLVGQTLITAVTSPAISQPTWFEYAGSYTVGTDCDVVRMSLYVNNNASNGTIHWDDAGIYKDKQTIPQTWIANLVPDILGVRQFINDVIDGIISAVRGIPFVGGNIAQLLMWLTGWKEETVATDGKATAAKAGMENTREIITATATNTPLSITPTDPAEVAVVEALTAQSQAIIALNAATDRVDAQIISETNAGVAVVDPVEDIYVNELNPAVWQEFTLEGSATDGWLETADGQNITMGWLGSATVTKMYRWIGEGEHTLTNYQKVTVSVATGLKYPFLDGRRPHHAVYCRVSDDGTKWVRAYFTNKNALIVDYSNGGSSGILFNSGEDYSQNPAAGSSLSIEPGVGTDERLFKIWNGRTPLVIVDDVSNLTDVNQFGHGIGMRVASGYGPGAFTQYTAVDNKPAPVPGTHLHVARLTTGSSTIGEGNDIVVFSASALKQNGIDWNGTYATIKTSGTYTIIVRIKHSSWISNNNDHACILAVKVNGVVQPLGPSLAGGIGGLLGQNPYLMRIDSLYIPLTIPLNAGDQVQPMLYANNGNSFPCVGDVNGIQSYMLITKSN